MLQFKCALLIHHCVSDLFSARGSLISSFARPYINTCQHHSICTVWSLLDVHILKSILVWQSIYCTQCTMNVGQWWWHVVQLCLCYIYYFVVLLESNNQICTFNPDKLSLSVALLAAFTQHILQLFCHSPLMCKHHKYSHFIHATSPHTQNDKQTKGHRNNVGVV